MTELMISLGLGSLFLYIFMFGFSLSKKGSNISKSEFNYMIDYTLASGQVRKDFKAATGFSYEKDGSLTLEIVKWRQTGLSFSNINYKNGACTKSKATTCLIRKGDNGIAREFQNISANFCLNVKNIKHEDLGDGDTSYSELIVAFQDFCQEGIDEGKFPLGIVPPRLAWIQLNFEEEKVDIMINMDNFYGHLETQQRDFVTIY